jgi:anhydro-N-acetylmuramic acid kinase
MAKSENLLLGMMSGTSIDGIDTVLIRCLTEDKMPELIATHFQPIDDQTKNDLLDLCNASKVKIRTLGQMDTRMGHAFADAALNLLKSTKTKATDISAIGCHGQTIYHAPNDSFPFTMQIGDPNLISERTGITTIADFRRRDIAAGGQGAPIAPLFHRLFFKSTEHSRVVLNLGGIANITFLDPEKSEAAFDTGPANILMDYWVNKHKNKPYDHSGEWASSGVVDESLLRMFREEDYFSLPKPKSTGRELFNADWLESKLSEAASDFTPSAVQATLLELTASTISDAIAPLQPVDEILVCGGGAHNSALLSRLQTLLEKSKITSTATLGLNPDWVEATAFAWMAGETLAGRRLDTRSFTGAKHSVYLGAIYKA